MLLNIYQLAVKEFLHLLRDKRTLVFLILMPSALTLLFGAAIGSSKVTGIKTRLLDRDGGPVAVRIIEAMRADETFKLTVINSAVDGDVASAEASLQRDTLKALVVIPSGFSARVERGERAELRVVADASDTFAAPAVLRSLGDIAVRNNFEIAAASLLRAGVATTPEQAMGKVAPVQLATDLRYNPELRPQNFTMPGVIGLILQLLTIIVMATSIARERERGTFEQLNVTPLTGAEIFIGKLLPYFVLALVDTVNVMVVARLFFDVKLEGHYLVVSALVVVFALGSLGIGQLISVVSRNQGQAIQLAVFYIMPVFVLSGAFAPLETLPDNVRPISYVFPLTYFCRSFRAALLRGASFAEVSADLLAMSAFAVVTFAVSVVVLWRQAARV